MIGVFSICGMAASHRHPFVDGPQRLIRMPMKKTTKGSLVRAV
jgi:hypothetical protein